MGSNVEDQTVTFACGECGESIQVDDPMREALIDRGCVICGAAVSPTWFDGTTAAGE